MVRFGTKRVETSPPFSILLILSICIKKGASNIDAPFLCEKSNFTY
jgi:hypothetical protein